MDSYRGKSVFRRVLKLRYDLSRPTVRSPPAEERTPVGKRFTRSGNDNIVKPYINYRKQSELYTYLLRKTALQDTSYDEMSAQWFENKNK